jgi:hypothetical protein
MERSGEIAAQANRSEHHKLPWRHRKMQNAMSTA